jgi:hypothetical protein
MSSTAWTGRFHDLLDSQRTFGRERGQGRLQRLGANLLPDLALDVLRQHDLFALAFLAAGASDIGADAVDGAAMSLARSRVARPGPDRSARTRATGARTRPGGLLRRARRRSSACARGRTRLVRAFGRARPSQPRHGGRQRRRAQGRSSRRAADPVRAEVVRVSSRTAPTGGETQVGRSSVVQARSASMSSGTKPGWRPAASGSNSSNSTTWPSGSMPITERATVTSTASTTRVCSLKKS